MRSEAPPAERVASGSPPKGGVSRGESPVGAQAPYTRMPTRTRPGLRWARPSGATTDCYPDDHAPTPPRDSLPWSGDWTGTTRLRPPFRRWLHRRKVAGGLLSFASRLAVSRGSARTSRAAARPRSVNALLIPASCPSHAASVEPLRVHRQRRWFAEEQSPRLERHPVQMHPPAVAAECQPVLTRVQADRYRSPICVTEPLHPPLLLVVAPATRPVE